MASALGGLTVMEADNQGSDDHAWFQLKNVHPKRIVAGNRRSFRQTNCWVFAGMIRQWSG